MAGAAAGGAQRDVGGGGTFNLYIGLPCVPVFSRAPHVPQKKFFWKQLRIGPWADIIKAITALLKNRLDL